MKSYATAAVAVSFALGAAASPQYPTETTTTYACNPAHQYPTGQVCTEISGSLTLITTTGASAYPTASASASTTTYACNPAHQYPTGQVCTEIGGSLTLITTTSANAYPTASASSGFACNPAHSYPEGRVCTSVSGSLTLLPPKTTATPSVSLGEPLYFTPSGSATGSKTTGPIQPPIATGAAAANRPVAAGVLAAIAYAVMA